MLYTVQWEAGPYSGERSVHAEDDEQAIAMVRRAVQREMGLAQYADGYEVIGAEDTFSENAEYPEIPTAPEVDALRARYQPHARFLGAREAAARMIEDERPFDPEAPPTWETSPHHFAVNSDFVRDALEHARADHSPNAGSDTAYAASTVLHRLGKGAWIDAPHPGEELWTVGVRYATPDGGMGDRTLGKGSSWHEALDTAVEACGGLRGAALHRWLKKTARELIG